MGRPLISEMPWFVSKLSHPDAPRTVIAGTDFANRLVGIFETPEEAQALVAAHNASLKQNGPAEAATSPSHGPNPTAKDGEENTMENSSVAAQRASASITYRHAFADLENLIALTRRRVVASSHFLGLIAENPPEDGIHKVSATLLDAIVSTLYDAEDTAKELEDLYNARCNSLMGTHS